MTLHQAVLALHLLAVAVGIGIGFTNLINMQISKGQSGDIAKGLAMHRLGLLRYSDIAIATILVTGFILAWMMGGPFGPWFSAKMVAVLVMVAAFVALRITIGQMRRTGNMALASRLALLSPVITGSAILALIFAVMAFEA